ncbi:MAG: 30S ribosomal protein S20 [Terrimicrobiaceae bacterium]|nr:30S ribosomal protein S20 [Terrimicrobiaceae bacterium]
MANTKSAAKRARQSVVRTARNSSVLTGLKNQQKKFRKAIADGNIDAAKADYRTVVSALDKAAKRGVIHKNVANRRKSQIGRALKPAAAAA